MKIGSQCDSSAADSGHIQELEVRNYIVASAHT